MKKSAPHDPLLICAETTRSQAGKLRKGEIDGYQRDDQGAEGELPLQLDKRAKQRSLRAQASGLQLTLLRTSAKQRLLGSRCTTCARALPRKRAELAPRGDPPAQLSRPQCFAAEITNQHREQSYVVCEKNEEQCESRVYAVTQRHTSPSSKKKHRHRGGTASDARKKSASAATTSTTTQAGRQRHAAPTSVGGGRGQESAWRRRDSSSSNAARSLAAHVVLPLVVAVGEEEKRKEKKGGSPRPAEGRETSSRHRSFRAGGGGLFS
ncbi:hypothetical protein HPB50_024619 [Hyalomma asiaticum]|uniref:Uncharacterized protein n=1 Tax=Hyalomma asiaticum TaxID=266040 RepID=A0ACB7SH20_HYAAI|nr:hypothetical protein HPB50_024619 [Hyalomma asiaticum]